MGAIVLIYKDTDQEIYRRETSKREETHYMDIE